jgi:2-polyprenyl-3-methyl-5-hydroxy-6-metoxy-1,4-benzoquinol methylase
MKLTDRQQREIEFHAARARENAALLEQPFSYEVLDRPSRRWWNGYWRMYELLVGLNLQGKRVLIVGCGFGEDALRLAKLGARVSAFDLSPDSIAIARQLAAREGLEIEFDVMAAEKLEYPAGSFDCVLARDILHHVDLPVALAEILRVCKPGAWIVANEVYSHSSAERLRRSKLVVKVLYPAMRTWVYGKDNDPYITPDERKLLQHDIRLIKSHLAKVEFQTYFNFIATRVVPGRVKLFAQIDRLLLLLLRPLAPFLGGRCMLAGRVL